MEKHAKGKWGDGGRLRVTRKRRPKLSPAPPSYTRRLSDSLRSRNCTDRSVFFLFARAKLKKKNATEAKMEKKERRRVFSVVLTKNFRREPPPSVRKNAQSELYFCPSSAATPRSDSLRERYVGCLKLYAMEVQELGGLERRKRHVL
ncbi:hypothetical protein Trydic_g23214 [Trypoxylus dichotomus]